MCLFPTLIKNKKYTPTKKNGGIVPKINDLRIMAIPIGCGFCMECRRQKAKEWQVRLLEDVKHNTNGKFITLTFSNESIKQLETRVKILTTKIKTGIKKQWIDKNGKEGIRYKYKTLKTECKLEGYDMDNAIATTAIRDFAERWRKKYKKAVRHWFITELGHKGTENIHLHGIIWTDIEEKEIRNIWRYGHIWIGKHKENGKIVNYVNGKTANYVTKYIQKMDFDHKYYKPKILTSAGIGGGYMKRTDYIKNKYKENNTQEYYKTTTGHKLSLPTYWRNKIYSEEEREKLWLEKLNKEVRYILGEEIKVGTQAGIEDYYKTLEYARRKNKQLGYGSNEIDWTRKKYEEERRNLLRKQRTGELETYHTERNNTWNYVSEEIWG